MRLDYMYVLPTKRKMEQQMEFQGDPPLPIPFLRSGDWTPSGLQLLKLIMLIEIFVSAALLQTGNAQ